MPFITGLKRKHDDTDCYNNDDEDAKDCKKPKTGVTNDHEGLIPDFHRTGGKCVTGGFTDPKLPGRGYHVTGVLRTKPGRGDPTQSMSCSDKLMRWNYLGCQGGLLHHYLTDPVYFSTMTFGDRNFNEEAITRALVVRLADCPSFQQFVTNSPIIGSVEINNETLFEGNDRKILHTGK